MIRVQSWDELLDLGAEQILGKAPQDMLTLREDLVLEIRICGQAWGGFIDYRGAKFVLELQETVNRIYRETAGDSIAPLKNLSRQITVKVRVQEGSSLIQINATEALNRMINTMTGDQITLIVGLAILCAAGYMTVKKVLEYKARKIEVAAQQQTSTHAVTRLASTIDKALDVIQKADATSPPRRLVRELEKGDSIVFPDNERLDHITAKLRYPKKPPSSVKNEYIDDHYTIKAIEMDNHPPSFIIEKEGFKFKATAQLQHTDIERLARDLEAALKSGDQLIVPLQVFISYSATGIKQSAITGIGEKRSDAKNVLDLTAAWS